MSDKAIDFGLGAAFVSLSYTVAGQIPNDIGAIGMAAGLLVAYGGFVNRGCDDMTTDYEETLDDALDLWGESLQITVAIEELSELTTELARMERGTGDPDAVIEELADCEIILDQLSKVYGTDAVNAEIERKMDRLRGRIEEDYEDAE